MPKQPRSSDSRPPQQSVSAGRPSIFSARERLPPIREARKRALAHCTKEKVEAELTKARDEYARNPPPLDELVAEAVACVSHYGRHIEERIEEDARNRNDPVRMSLEIHLSGNLSGSDREQGATLQNILDWMRKRWLAIPEKRVAIALDAALGRGLITKARTTGRGIYFPANPNGNTNDKGQAGDGETQNSKAKALARHSPDFRSVHWYGTDYSFTAIQAACVKVLWEAWENGTPGVGGSTLLQEAGSARADSPGGKLKDLFKRRGATHPAWGTMILKGNGRDIYRLAEPKN